ncbi:MAG TPA: TIGR00730 family Rossman fold protein [Acidimicrobiales bacterium]|nr:TIGR00730 family Rossman fold protein [Acidimicrobiales bacterium]
MRTPPRPLRAISDEATSEYQMLAGRDSRTQELLRVMRISREFIRGFRALHNIGPCITFFGASRFGETHPYYEPSRQLARRVAELGFNIITGGGPGLMEAANRGARDGGAISIGATIDIGTEPPNAFVDRRIAFHYFFARKVTLVKYSYGFVMLPGGMGTLDEMFEAVTLIQTARLSEFPIILYGREYWDGLIDWLREVPLATGAFSPADLARLRLTDDDDEIVERLARLAGHLHLEPVPR